MWEVNTNLSVKYNIHKVSDAFDFNIIPSKRWIVVIDQTVYDLYKDDLSYTELLVIKATEADKSLDTAKKVLEFFEQKNILRRSEPVIAIGGGVLLDIVGFCCSMYRRGIPYVRIPTTLLGIVDASVGAKTSVNHFGRRNRIGSYYPPLFTLIDTRFIKTQDHREIASGVAEIIKLGIILDKELFELLEQEPQTLLKKRFQNSELANSIIDKAISVMIKELSHNLWEEVLTRPVDFGHSFSPMIEMKNVTSLLHGEAVILDCLLSCCISNLRGYLSNDCLQRVFKLVKNWDLPVSHNDFYNIDLLWSGLKDTTTHRNGNQYVPIPVTIGECTIINDISYIEVQRACDKMKGYRNI